MKNSLTEMNAPGSNPCVPEICRFFGIIIRMFAEPSAQHHRPHFHVYYQNQAAVFSMDTIKMIGGTLSLRE